MAKSSSFESSDAIHSAVRAAESSTKRRETADFERLSPGDAGTSPTGSRTARPNLRVDTLISMRFMAHCPSQSSACVASQLGKGSSAPSRLRTRGRSTGTVPP
jgi:hypothetical protein